jgi:L-amino acid N-acyltransferase YncA
MLNTCKPIVREMNVTDWDMVRAIYLEGIATGNATFQTSVPLYSIWNEEHLSVCRLVVEVEGEVLGWAALGAFSSRAVYYGVAKVSIYVAKKSWGRGLGHTLLSELVNASEKGGFWSLEAAILDRNIASIKLHKRCNFRIVGVRKKLGKLDGKWRDVILMERRSKVII